MSYKTIFIDEKKLTIMGISFPDIKSLRNTANALGSNMFEGFEPTRELVRIYRDYRAGKISNKVLIESLKKLK
jgi:putative transcriptional regulator